MEASGRLFFGLLVRTEQKPDALTAEIQNAIRQFDPDAIMFNV
jgi:hypothetical protein